MGGIEEALADLDKAMKGDDKAQIEAKIARVEEVAQSLRAAATAGSQAGADGGAQAGPGQPEDVVDAEFTEVKDDQK
ncbi:MAG: molecular chaperone DnaK, partial [Dokdonella sp.]